MDRGTWMTSCPEAMGWGFWNLKKAGSWDLGLDEASRFSELVEASPVVCGGVPHVVGSDGKVSIERNCVCLSLSLLVSKNLTLKKVIKKFRTWTNFMYFGIPSVYFTYSYLDRIFLDLYEYITTVVFNTNWC